MKDYHKCGACSEVFEEHDIPASCTHRETLYTPAEYEWHCPACHALDQFKEIFRCEGCGEFKPLVMDDYCAGCWAGIQQEEA